MSDGAGTYSAAPAGESMPISAPRGGMSQGEVKWFNDRGRVSAIGINDFDEIVGAYDPSAGPHRLGFLATPVPEPATLFLLAAALLGLAPLRRSARAT